MNNVSLYAFSNVYLISAKGSTERLLCNSLITLEKDSLLSEKMVKASRMSTN